MKTLELTRPELDKLLSEVKKFNLEIDEYYENRNIEEMIGSTDDDICLFLDINVIANERKYTYDNETGYEADVVRVGTFELIDIKPYCEDIGDVHLVDWQMKLIEKTIADLKLFD
jgi:hypothetical protein